MNIHVSQMGEAFIYALGAEGCAVGWTGAQSNG